MRVNLKEFEKGNTVTIIYGRRTGNDTGPQSGAKAQDAIGYGGFTVKSAGAPGGTLSILTGDKIG